MKSRLIIFLSIVFSIILLVIIGFLSHNIKQVQNEVYVRDSLINVKTERELKTKEETNELIKSLSSLFENSSLTKDGKFDVKDFIKRHEGLKDSIEILNNSLELIKKNYGISTSVRKTTKDSRLITTTSIRGSAKVDSALVLLPYFRDRLVSNEDNTWSISLTGEEYDKIKKNYVDNLARYNSLVNNYNELLKEYNVLVQKYNNKVDFYRKMLTEMSKKGLVSIDSSTADIVYTY